MGLTVQHVSNWHWHGENFTEAAPSHVMEGIGVRQCLECQRMVIRGAGRWWENERLVNAWKIVGWVR